MASGSESARSLIPASWITLNQETRSRSDRLGERHKGLDISATD